MSAETVVRNGVCAYCERGKVMTWFSGRRWLCRECWIDAMGIEP